MALQTNTICKDQIGEVFGHLPLNGKSHGFKTQQIYYLNNIASFSDASVIKSNTVCKLSRVKAVFLCLVPRIKSGMHIIFSSKTMQSNQ